MNSFLYDLRLALRRLAQQWRFSITVVAILGLGIGASVAVFSLMDAVALRDLPFSDPDRLVRIYSTNPGRNIQFFSTSATDFLDWQQQARTFDVAAMELLSETLTGEAEPARVRVAAVTQGFAPMLGIEPRWGRWFTPEEDAPGASQTAVLSYELARDRFGSPDDALGQDVEINGLRRKVVGVVAPGFRFPHGADLWRTQNLVYSPGNRDNRELDVFGKMHPGVTLPQAQIELEATAAAIERDYPDKNAGWSARADGLRSALVPESVESGLSMIFGAVLLVLLIACFNVAGLLLARADRRRREMVVQTALGASRARLLRQAFAETLALAAAGASTGALLAVWFVAAAAAFAADTAPLAELARVDLRALAFAAALTVVVAFLTGLAPAMRISGVKVADSLRESGRTASAGRSTQRFRRVLAVAQLAVSLALLVGAGLLIESLRRLEHAPLGFQPDSVMTATVAASREALPSQERWTAFFQQTLERIRQAPGVVSAGLSSGLPLSTGNTSINISSPEPSALDPGATLQTYWRVVSPGFFETLRIPILEGESFRDLAPGADAAQVILSQAAARALWPNESAVGRQIRIGSSGSALRIVGVADDVRQRNLEAFAGPGIYVHYAYWGWGVASFAVRTSGDPTTAVASIREAVAGLDPNMPLFDVKPMRALVSDAAGQARFQSLLLTGFAAAAALLAAVGLYGVLAFMIEQRRGELALRLAVGATWADIQRLVLGNAVRLWAVGAAAGLLLAWTLSRWIQTFLYDVAPTDPTVYAAVTALLALVALAAAWLPARRAARVDPATALR
ncbi:MAG: ABC transporter permease, partial [Acidobacteria bacterium]|nr:ABC transporter permease [Acidobacteriota bacterium]